MLNPVRFLMADITVMSPSHLHEPAHLSSIALVCAQASQLQLVKYTSARLVIEPSSYHDGSRLVRESW